MATVDTTEFLQLGTHRFSSRLIVGTGKYASYELMGESLERSGTECITVAIRRERLIDSAGNNLLTLINDILDLSKIEAGAVEVQPEEFAPRDRKSVV